MKFVSPEFADRRQMIWSVAVLLFLVSGAIISNAYMAELDGAAAETRKTSIHSVELLAQIQYDMLRYRQIEAAHALSVSKGRAEEKATLADLQTEIAKSLKQYAPLIRSSQDQWLADRFIDAWRVYLVLDSRLTGLSNRNDLDNASAFYTGEMRRVFNEMAGQLGLAIEVRTEAARTAEATSERLIEVQRILTFTAILSALLLATAVVRHPHPMTGRTN